MWKIMIVDDDYIVRRGMMELIHWSDMRCEVISLAEDGVDALEKLQMEQPDILFTDVVMPRLDGLELLRLVRQSYPDMHTVIISAYDEAASIRRALQYEAVDFLIKPIDERGVFEALTRAKIRFLQQKYFESIERESWQCAYPFVAALEEGNRDKALQKAMELLKPFHAHFIQQASCCVDLLMFADDKMANAQSRKILLPALLKILGVEEEDALWQIVRESICEICEQTASYGKNAMIVNTVIKMVRENYQNMPTITQMAQQLGISENHLQAIFKRKMGMTIRQFLTQVRLECAAKWLVTTNEKVFTIATKVGYHDVDHFTRVFRDRMGMLPNAYREKYRC